MKTEIRTSLLRPMRILIVDDHELTRIGLAQLIGHEANLDICGEAAGEDEAQEMVRRMRPDLVIADISLKQGSGIELVKWIKNHHPNVATIVSSAYDESMYAERALRAGAMGYVNKLAPASTIIDAVRHVLAGSLYFSEGTTQRLMRSAMVGGNAPDGLPIDSLSDRELEVLQLTGEGLTINELADRLQLSPRTIETYRRRLKTKLNLQHASELNREAIRWVLQAQLTSSVGADCEGPGSL